MYLIPKVAETIMLKSHHTQNITKNSVNKILCINNNFEVQSITKNFVSKILCINNKKKFCK